VFLVDSSRRAICMNDLERPDHIPADFALWEKAGHARPRVTLIWRRSAPIPCSA